MTRPPRPQADLLERVAAAMGTTSAAFFIDDLTADGSVPSEVVAAQEGADLMKAFSTITDPEVRKQCLAYVQAAATVFS